MLVKILVTQVSKKMDQTDINLNVHAPMNN